MSLRLVHTIKEAGTEAEALATLAEVSAVIGELRRFVTECRDDPSSMGQLTLVDLAQAKALLAAARSKLAHARLNSAGRDP